MRFWAPFVLLCAGAPECPGQWTVYDPAVHRQQIISTAQEVAKFVEVIGKQVEQINLLNEEIATLHHYVELFGNPAEVALPVAERLGTDLLREPMGDVLGEIVAASEPVAAMIYTGHGLFRAIGREFETPGGARVSRQEWLYRPIAAVQDTAENYMRVLDDVAHRRAALKKEIAEASAELASARSDAQVQKLTGLLVSLEAALRAADQEVSHATASALVQDIATRAEAQRQVHARREEAHAEFTEALDKFRTTFRLMTEPVAFPTREEGGE